MASVSSPSQSGLKSPSSIGHRLWHGSCFKGNPFPWFRVLVWNGAGDREESTWSSGPVQRGTWQKTGEAFRNPVFIGIFWIYTRVRERRGRQRNAIRRVSKQAGELKSAMSALTRLLFFARIILQHMFQNATPSPMGLYRIQDPDSTIR